MADPSCNEACSVQLSILHSSSSTDLTDSSKSLDADAAFRDHAARTEPKEEDGFDEPNCRTCLEPTQIVETGVNPLLDFGCHCRGDLAHAHKRRLVVWIASRRRLISIPNPNSRPLKDPKKWEICRGDLSTGIVMMVVNYTIAKISSQYQAGGAAVLTYPHLQLLAFWMGEEYSHRIMETIFGAAGSAIVLVVYVYVEVWYNL